MSNRPLKIIVQMSPATAIIHWQICETFASLPGLPPVGRVRAHQLAEQYMQLARGDIPNNRALSDTGRDVLTAGALDEHEPRAGARLLSYTVRFNDFAGAPLEDGRPAVIVAAHPWAVLHTAVAIGRRLPAGLTSWLREAMAGDSANMLDSQNRVRVHAEVRAAVSAIADI